jgi:hypothetical protein
MKPCLGAACFWTLTQFSAAFAQSYIFDCQPDAWMQNGVATPMSSEEKAAWPHRLVIFLAEKTGNGCDLDAAVKGCTDAPLWSGSSDDTQSSISLARYRPMVTEPDMLMIAPAKETFFGSFDGKAVAGHCRILDLTAGDAK